MPSSLLVDKSIASVCLRETWHCPFMTARSTAQFINDADFTMWPVCIARTFAVYAVCKLNNDVCMLVCGSTLFIFLYCRNIVPFIKRFGLNPVTGEVLIMTCNVNELYKVQTLYIITYAAGSQSTGRLICGICNSVSVCLYVCSKRKTIWAINTKFCRNAVYGSCSVCSDPEVKGRGHAVTKCTVSMGMPANMTA